MKRLKIGLFNDSFFPGMDGVIMVVDNYARIMSEYADVVVVVPAYYKKFDDSKLPYKVIRVKGFNIPLTNYTFSMPTLEMGLYDELIEEDFDIIHIHSPFPIGKLGVRIGKKLNVPVIGTMHSQMKYEFMRYTKSKTITDQLTNNAMKVYDDCDICWAVNSRIGEIFIEYGYKGQPGVQENGTDMKLVEDVKEANKTVNKLYNIKEDEAVLLFIGRINVVKNILFIVDVLNELKNKNVKFKMLFVGSGPDEDQLKAKIEEYEFKDEIVLCGEVKDRELLKKIYFRSKLFVFPSLFDASSLVQIEAASQKTPTIFIEGAATANTITPEVNGYVAEENVEVFSNKIIEILSNEKKYKTISENAYKQVYKPWNKIVNDVYKRYLEIVKKQKKEK